MINEKPNIELIKKLKKQPEFEGLSDKEIDNILMALETFSVLVFNLHCQFQKKRN